MVCVGYAGTEAFDMVLYIGHTLTRLKYPVLIVDLSDSGALKNAIYHGMDIDSRKEIVHYRNLNYIRRLPDEFELKEFEDGVVFVNFGFNYRDTGSIRLDYLNIVVNAFSHITEKVNDLLKDSLPDNLNLRLLVRDIISLDDLERVKNSLKFSKKPDSVNYLYLDYKDYENAVKCQWLQTVRFRKVSYRMKKVIAGEIKYINALINASTAPASSFAGKGE